MKPRPGKSNLALLIVLLVLFAVPVGSVALGAISGLIASLMVWIVR